MTCNTYTAIDVDALVTALEDAQARIEAVTRILSSHDCEQDHATGIFGRDVRIAHETLGGRRAKAV